MPKNNNKFTAKNRIFLILFIYKGAIISHPSPPLFVRCYYLICVNLIARITLLESRTKIDLNEAALLTYCVLA